MTEIRFRNLKPLIVSKAENFIRIIGLSFNDIKRNEREMVGQTAVPLGPPR